MAVSGIAVIRRLPPLLGLVGTLVIAIASFVTAVAYTGSANEPYSPLNHWISELGRVGVSELSLVFNIGLIVGGVCFAIFMVGLRAARGGVFAWIYGTIGAVAGAAGSFVGIFPMNDLERHGLAALMFFNLGWIAVALASIDFVRRPDPRFPRSLAVIGAITAGCFIAFLAIVFPLATGEGLGAPAVRHTVWLVAVLEWAALIGILAWVFATGWTWWRSANDRVD